MWAPSSTVCCRHDIQPVPLPPLQGKKLLRGVAVQRITFVEVTRAAVLAALAAPRDLATPLVEAYLARRALDYLLGFHLTPVLWRKLPAARSAGGSCGCSRG
jgi:DNA topoisomerase I